MSQNSNIDMSSVNHTCSDSSDSEITKAKIIRKFKRKLLQKQKESDSDSDTDFFRKKIRTDDNLPKYYEYNSIQNQEGFFGGLLDVESDKEDNSYG